MAHNVYFDYALAAVLNTSHLYKMTIFLYVSVVSMETPWKRGYSDFYIKNNLWKGFK